MSYYDDYSIESAADELQAVIDEVSDLVTHPSITFATRTCIQDALDNLKDAAEMLVLDEELSKGSAYWQDAVKEAEADGTYHLKPVIKSAEASAATINKALAQIEKDDSRWTSRYLKRQVVPTGIRREVLTFNGLVDLGSAPRATASK